MTNNGELNLVSDGDADDHNRVTKRDDDRDAVKYLEAFCISVCERIDAASELISSSDDYPDEVLADLVDEVERHAASLIAEIRDADSSS